MLKNIVSGFKIILDKLDEKIIHSLFFNALWMIALLATMFFIPMGFIFLLNVQTAGCIIGSVVFIATIKSSLSRTKSIHCHDFLIDHASQSKAYHIYLFLVEGLGFLSFYIWVGYVPVVVAFIFLMILRFVSFVTFKGYKNKFGESVE